MSPTLWKALAFAVSVSFAAPVVAQQPESSVDESSIDTPLTFDELFMKRDGPLQSVPHECVRPAKHFWYDKSREEGERDIVAATHTAKVEELWIYIPGRWYEVGVCEKHDRVDSQGLAKLVWERVPKNVREASVYHLHLASEGHLGEVPSYNDFVSASGGLRWLSRFLPEATADYRLGTATGVYVITLRPDSPVPEGLANRIDDFLRTKQSDAYPRLYKLPEKISSADENKDFCERLNQRQDVFQVQFYVP